MRINVIFNCSIEFMISIKLETDEHGKGTFKAYDNNEFVGLMRVHVSGKILKAIHTEVEPTHEEKGIAHQLLNNMVAYARENQMRVIPLCPFVLAEFKRHPELYQDIWMLGKQN